MGTAYYTHLNAALPPPHVSGVSPMISSDGQYQIWQSWPKLVAIMSSTAILLINVKMLCPWPLHLPGSRSESSWPLHLPELSTFVTVELWRLNILYLWICCTYITVTLKNLSCMCCESEYFMLKLNMLWWWCCLLRSAHLSCWRPIPIYVQYSRAHKAPH